jgi:hypothetical protein
MDRDETLGLKHAKCLTHDGQADSELLGQDFLPGKSIFRRERAIENLAAEPFGNHVGQPRLPQPGRRNRVMNHPSIPFVLAGCTDPVQSRSSPTVGSAIFGYALIAGDQAGVHDLEGDIVRLVPLRERDVLAEQPGR